MIYLKNIDTNLLKNDKKVTVAIIDAGFKKIPRYAHVLNINENKYQMHGNRVLSIFTALDELYPIPNLQLYLLSYSIQQGYGGLIKCISLLPQKIDILSISIAWKDDNREVFDLLFKKANKICVPYSKDSSLPYPSSYKNVINCSNTFNMNADYCITPNINWRGNSYAVPAIARLLAYDIPLKNEPKGLSIQELFTESKKEIKINYQKSNNNILSCPYCKRVLKTKYFTFMKEIPETCPYCGRRLK